METEPAWRADNGPLPQPTRSLPNRYYGAMPKFRRGVKLSNLEAFIHGRHGTGTTFAALGRELGLSASYVSAVHQVAVRKLAAQCLRGRGRRIDFLSRE